MTIRTKVGAAVLDIKSSGTKGEIEGYASTFGGEPDLVGDIVAPGAYAKSLEKHRLKKTMPKMFWQHDANQPIGKWIEVSEDTKGLHVIGQLNLGVRRAAEANELLRAGDIDGLSIGYKLRDYDPDPEDPKIWTLTEIDLFEISVVSIGANENATIDAVKAEKAGIAKTDALIAKVAAGDRLTEREFEDLAKGTWCLSNSQAERAARVHLKGQGEPAEADQEALNFLRALSA